MFPSHNHGVVDMTNLSCGAADVKNAGATGFVRDAGYRAP
jgi:hypothetical protein